MQQSCKMVSWLSVLFLLGPFSSQAHSAPSPVNGIVGGTVLLSVIDLEDHQVVVEVRWTFGSADTTRVRLGYSKGTEFVQYLVSHTNYTQLIKRLEMYNKFTLRIRNLTKIDSGLYEADVQFKDGNSSEVEFQLNLFDPVPEPHIEEKSRTHTSDGCNIMLECQPSNTSSGRDLIITWFQENLSERSHVRLSNGSLLNVSLKTYNSGSVSSTYICFISNPADTKNRSISLACPGDSDKNRLVTMYVFLSIAFLCFSFCGACFCWKKKRKEKLKVVCTIGAKSRAQSFHEPRCQNLPSTMKFASTKAVFEQYSPKRNGA